MKNYMMLVIISFIISGCATEIILPGLCYTDKTGTFLCPEIDEIKDPIHIDPPIPPYDRPQTCMMMYGIDPDQWRMCMDPDNDYYYDPYYEERQKLMDDLHEQNLRKRILYGTEAIA